MRYALRNYQETFVACIRDAFRQHKRVLAVSPTGSGKTVCFAYITTNAAAKGNRVYVVAHRTEIVNQISTALDAMGVRHGRIQPNHSATDDPVQVAMIQTLARRHARYAPPDFLIVDEAHHCAADSYDAVCNLWPDAKILGVTATPQRLDGKGLGRMFGAMVEGPTTSELIRTGWLARYTYLAPPPRADLSRVGTRMGDYKIDELAEAMDKAVITGDAIEHYKKYLFPRSAIVFCVRVDHAEHVAAQFLAAGVRAASVDGTMDRATRRDRIEGLADGRYQILTSCALISEGLDIPDVGGVILLRPTKSVAMFLQQIGRALRPKPSGENAIILDHVGNIIHHGLPDAQRPWTLDDRKKKPAADPVTQCEVCFRVFPTYPGWKTEYLEAIAQGREPDCDVPDDDDCVLHNSSGAILAPPDVVAGQLQEFTSTPDWAGGCNILLARGAEWSALLGHADTREKLDYIRKARNYNWRWVNRILEGRARAKRAA